MEEAAWTLRDYLGKLESDPGRLEEVEARLDALDKLKRKYGGTLDEVLAFLEQVARQVDEVENATEHQEALEKEQKRLAGEYEKLAADTERETARSSRATGEGSGNRTEVAGNGGNAISRQRASRRNCRLPARTRIEFLVSPNRGEELRPMGKIASGGELSRMALALKTAMGDADTGKGVHTLVFDEVDAGVGGAAAASVGRRLKALARTTR